MTEIENDELFRPASMRRRAGIAAHERHRFPTPWREAIVAATQRRGIFATPIAEYVPDRLVRGRLALVGDVAHVATPMTWSGLATTFEELLALECLAETRCG